MYKAMDCWENQYKIIHVHRQYKIIPVYVQGYGLEYDEKTSITLYLSMYKAMDCWENQYKIIHVHRQYKIIPQHYTCKAMDWSMMRKTV